MWIFQVRIQKSTGSSGDQTVTNAPIPKIEKSKHRVSRIYIFFFSWNELGYYDIPANIDLILNVTGQETLSYVGHSQGGTSFLVMASTKPEYLAKISMAHLLGPVVYMDYTRIPFIQGAIQNEEAFEVRICSLTIRRV